MNTKKSLHYAFSALLVLVLISPEVFAAQSWQPAVAAALLIATFLVAVAYMVVYIMKLEQLKPILKDEVGQIIMTGAIVGVIILGSTTFDNAIKQGVFTLSDADNTCTGGENQMYCDTLIKENGGYKANRGDIRVWAIELNKKNIKFLETKTTFVNKFVSQVGAQSARSGLCNLLGIGFTIAGCNSWGVLRTPAGQMLNALGFATMDLQAERILLEICQKIALALLLPLGVLLRSIYFTRNAGSTIIALALSLYFVFPSVIIMGQAASDAFIAQDNHPEYAEDLKYDLKNYECDPFDPEIKDLEGQMRTIMVGSPPLDEKFILFIIGRFMLMTALALTATLATVRGLGQALGTDINVMSIAKLS